MKSLNIAGLRIASVLGLLTKSFWRFVPLPKILKEWLEKPLVRASLWIAVQERLELLRCVLCRNWMVN